MQPGGLSGVCRADDDHYLHMHRHIRGDLRCGAHDKVDYSKRRRHEGHDRLGSSPGSHLLSRRQNSASEPTTNGNAQDLRFSVEYSVDDSPEKRSHQGAVCTPPRRGISGRHRYVERSRNFHAEANQSRPAERHRESRVFDRRTINRPQSEETSTTRWASATHDG